jgi:hypothetical protein
MMYELPTQLTGAAIEAIRTNLSAATELRDEVTDLTANGHYRISDYVSQAHSRFRAVYHGERDRFAVPQINALNRLDALREKEDATLDQQFSTTKTKLLSALNLYCKGLQRGLKEHDQEA